MLEWDVTAPEHGDVLAEVSVGPNERTLVVVGTSWKVITDDFREPLEVVVLACTPEGRWGALARFASAEASTVWVLALPSLVELARQHLRNAAA